MAACSASTPTAACRFGAALALASVAAASVALLFFFPPIVYWRDLDPEFQAPTPMANRAHEVLRQLADPAYRSANPSNQAINWRLLFPYLGHWLHLPANVFLALPHVGCLV